MCLFQVDLQDSCDKSPSCTFGTSQHRDKPPSFESLSSCVEELKNVIECAHYGLIEATQSWRNAHGRVDMMRIQSTKCLLNIVLSKKPTLEDLKLLDTPMDFQNGIPEVRNIHYCCNVVNVVFIHCCFVMFMCLKN